MTPKQFKQWLRKSQAGADAVAYYKSHNFDLQSAWAECPDVIWMAELLINCGHLSTQQLVRLAVIFARSVSHLNPDPRVNEAITTTENWLADPTEDNLKAVKAAANAAFTAAKAATESRDQAVAQSAGNAAASVFMENITTAAFAAIVAADSAVQQEAYFANPLDDDHRDEIRAYQVDQIRTMFPIFPL